MIPDNYVINTIDKYVEFVSPADNVTVMRVPYSNIVIPEIDPLYEIVIFGEWVFDETGTLSRFDTRAFRPLVDIKSDLLTQFRHQCRSLILDEISIEHQLDVALGVIPDNGYSDWIADMIIESNRCEDLCDDAETVDTLKLIVCSFPVYSGGE